MGQYVKFYLNKTIIMAISAVAVKKKVKIGWYPITFRPRQGGVNSINLKRIFKIGVKSLGDFRKINSSL